jgi:hypothetical protein
MSNRGFQLKPIRHLGFGSETICPSRGISDSAVKLSAQAEELEKPFRVFICRHWHCDSRSCGRNFLPFGREVEGLFEASCLLGRVQSLLGVICCCRFIIKTESSILQIMALCLGVICSDRWSVLVELRFQLAGPFSSYLEAASSSCDCMGG